jgi:hypothetical protein
VVDFFNAGFFQAVDLVVLSGGYFLESGFGDYGGFLVVFVVGVDGPEVVVCAGADVFCGQ